SKDPGKGAAAAEVSKKGRHLDRRPSNKPRGERKTKDSKNPGKGAAAAEVSPAKPVPQLPDGYIAVQMLATTKITPNDYNPNELAGEGMQGTRGGAQALGPAAKAAGREAQRCDRGRRARVESSPGAGRGGGAVRGTSPGRLRSQAPALKAQPPRQLQPGP